MAADRTFLAMTTGRSYAPMGGLHSAQGKWVASSAQDTRGALALALSILLLLPIGCRA